jgi:SRSO17 transposase
VDQREVEALNGELVGFVGEVFVSMLDKPGAVHRVQNACHHLRGSLLTDVKRKTATGMARVLGVRPQGLNHLVTDSPWEPEPVRRQIGLRAERVVRPGVWVVDDTTFPKDGHDSVGVARQHSGRAGGVVNCQAAVTVTACGKRGGIPLAWRLFLPESWNPDGVDGHRRAKCRVPEEVVHQRKWELALAGIDELLAWGLAPAPVLADSDYGKAAEFRAGLAERGLGFVVQVLGEVSLLDWRGAPDTPWAREGHHRAAAELAAATPRHRVQAVSWHTTDGQRVGQFSLHRVREAGIKVRQMASKATTVLPDRWLLVEWDTDDEHPQPFPARFWLADLPGVTRPSLQRLVRLAKTRWMIETSYRELKDTLGLDHFEGRTWHGWHRHVTLVTAALLFLTEHRARTTKTTAPA